MNCFQLFAVKLAAFLNGHLAPLPVIEKSSCLNNARHDGRIERFVERKWTLLRFKVLMSGLCLSNVFTLCFECFDPVVMLNLFLARSLEYTVVTGASIRRLSLVTLLTKGRFNFHLMISNSGRSLIEINKSNSN